MHAFGQKLTKYKPAVSLCLNHTSISYQIHEQNWKTETKYNAFNQTFIIYLLIYFRWDQKPRFHSKVASKSSIASQHIIDPSFPPFTFILGCAPKLFFSQPCLKLLEAKKLYIRIFSGPRFRGGFSPRTRATVRQRQSY